MHLFCYQHGVYHGCAARLIFAWALPTVCRILLGKTYANTSWNGACARGGRHPTHRAAVTRHISQRYINSRDTHVRCVGRHTTHASSDTPDTPCNGNATHLSAVLELPECTRLVCWSTHYACVKRHTDTPSNGNATHLSAVYRHSEYARLMC